MSQQDGKAGAVADRLGQIEEEVGPESAADQVDDLGERPDGDNQGGEEERAGDERIAQLHPDGGRGLIRCGDGSGHGGK